MTCLHYQNGIKFIIIARSDRRFLDRSLSIHLHVMQFATLLKAEGTRYL
jgi:hypothetical protein